MSAQISDPEDDFVQDLPDPHEIFIPSPQAKCRKAAKHKATANEESDSSVTELPVNRNSQASIQKPPLEYDLSGAE